MQIKIKARKKDTRKSLINGEKSLILRSNFQKDINILEIGSHIIAKLLNFFYDFKYFFYYYFIFLDCLVNVMS